MSAERRLLLVEGPDDAEFVKQLCNAHGFNPKEAPLFEIKASGGTRRQRVDLVLALATAVGLELEAVAVIADADVDAGRRWISLRDALQGEGYGPPETWPTDGWLGSAEGKPRVGVWIMGAPSGALEEHLLRTIAADDLLLAHAAKAVDTAPAHPRRFTATHRTKAVAHAFLALCEPPGSPLGIALVRRHFDANHESNAALARWLRRCFE